MDVLRFYRVKDWYKNLGITLIGFLCSQNPLREVFKPLTISALSLAYAFSLNDFFDGKRGEKNYISNLKQDKDLILFLIILPAIISGLLSLTTSLIVAIANLSFILLFTLYSAPPFLKKNWYFSLLINLICLGPSLFLLGEPKLNQGAVLTAFFLSSYILFSEIVHQSTDQKEDEKMGVNSFPINFGFENTGKVLIRFSWLMMALSLLILPFTFISFIPFLTWVCRYYRIKNLKSESKPEIRNRLFGDIEGLSYILWIILINNPYS